MARFLGILILGLLAALLVFIKLQPPLPSLSRQNVSLTFLGYTNGGSAGTRTAVFAVTNLADSKIQVYKPGVIGMVYDASSFSRFRAMLQSGASARFTLAVSTNLPVWRIALEADPDVSRTRALVRRVLGIARRLPYTIESDQIGTNE